MRKKRLIGIMTMITVLVLTAVGFKLVNMKSTQEKSTTESSEEATAGDGLTDDKSTSEGNDTDEKMTEDAAQEAKNSEDEYWEWHFETEQKDIETAQAGTIYNLDEIDDITYGGATYNIKNVIYIPERDMIPELVPGYDDYNMLRDPMYGYIYLDHEIETWGKCMLWCVEFDMTNNKNQNIEVYVDKLRIAITDIKGKKIDCTAGFVYVGGNEERVQTHKAYAVELAPGETKRMVVVCNTFYDDICSANPEWNDDYVFDYYIKLYPLVGGDGDGTIIDYVQDDTRYVYIKCGTGSINSLSEEYKDDEGE